MNSQEKLIKKLELEIADLKRQLEEKEKQLKQKKETVPNPYCDLLSTDEISRYSRQMILPEIRLKGQLKLKTSKILIVGAGGLGCPAALYLAAAGVGNITIVDSDEVELSNLHRQILHNEINIGLPKVESAQISLNRLNGNVNINTLQTHLHGTNILEIVKDFNIVVDGTDNVATRYLLNDACVFLNKPLVSGSALKFEGQLTVYHYKGGPCYRCLFPIPPPPDTVTSCGDGGVLGVVPGCIGILQALETIKIVLNMPDILSGKLLLFDASNTTFRKVSLRKRNNDCVVCGEKPSITAPIDYEQFCHAKASDKVDMIKLLASEDRVTVYDFDKIVKGKIKHILLDVRPELEFEICRLPHSINVPFTDFQKNLYKEKINSLDFSSNPTVFVVCRRGNDSQRAVNILQNQFKDLPCKFKDIIGGLHEYSAKIDSRFPVY